jgi:predicted transposase/invertase (TIGR01784 family)
MHPMFADPKTDLVFKRIFGNKAHKPVLIQLLNDLLGLPDDRLIVDVEYLTPEQVPRIAQQKNSIVDVKCRDQRGAYYVVEMQVLNVEAFEKRLIYNWSKGYSGQLSAGDVYPKLNDVVMVAICDFLLWREEEKQPGAIKVPMVSRFRMTEEETGARRFPQVRCVVMELPKYEAGPRPRTMVDRWAYFFRETQRLNEVPEALSEGRLREALEATRTMGFSPEEWEAYDREKVAEQDARGAVTLAQKLGYSDGLDEGVKKGHDAGLKEGHDAGLKEGHDAGLKEGHDAGLKEGHDAGLKEGLQQGIADLCEVLGIELTPARHEELRRLDPAGLVRFRDQLKRGRTWPG